MDTVLARMRQVCAISADTELRLRQLVTRCEFPRRYCLVREGVKEHAAYFIEKGMTRSYWLVDGQEYTTSFSVEGGIVFSMDELYYDEESQEYVETLEPTDAYRINLADLRTLFWENIEMANWGRIIHQDEYRRLHRSHKERLTLSAGERYAAFQQQFPEVCRRANLGFIASYLGITLSTLSRIRKEFVFLM